MNYKEICASVAIYTSVHPSKPRPVSVNKQFLRDLTASTKLNEWVYYMKEDTYKLLTQGNTEVWVSRNEIYVQTYEGANIWRVADDSSNTVNSAMPELAKAPLNLYVKLQQTLHRQVRSIHPTTGPFPPDMLKKLEKRDVETARIGYEAEIIVGDAWQAKREVLSKRENAIGLVRSNAGSDDLAALFGSQALAERVASMLNDEDVTEDEVREQALELACKNCATFNLIADPQWYMNKARSILEGTQTVDDVVPTKPVCTPTGTGGMCEQTVTASCDPAIEYVFAAPPKNDLDHCLDFDNIIHGYVDLTGKVMTILDAAYNNPAQNKAVKRLIKNAFNERMAMIQERYNVPCIPFPKEQDAPQRELPNLEDQYPGS